MTGPHGCEKHVQTNVGPFCPFTLRSAFDSVAHAIAADENFQFLQWYSVVFDLMTVCTLIQGQVNCQIPTYTIQLKDTLMALFPRIERKKN